MSKTTDAVAIIDNFIGDDEEMQQMMLESLLSAKVGQLVFDARHQAGLTQEQLANLIGVDISVITDVEEADYEGNALLVLQKVATALNQKLKLDLIPVGK